MPKLIKDGVIIKDSWLPINPEADTVGSGQICTLAQWLQLKGKQGSAVQLEPDEPPAPLLDSLQDIELVVVNFSAFMDGRGFSYGRELRERGFAGELRAGGHFIRDQLTYLQRVGFNAFQMADEAQLQEAMASLDSLSEFYQAAIDQPLPLFRRR